MKKLAPLFASLAMTVAAVSCGKGGGDVREAWNPINDPLRLQNDYVRSLAQLPTQGQLSVKPWSDSYWPTNQGGIAYRWQKQELGFSYAPHSEQRVRQMSQQELAELSPAEKYDIVNGRFDYPTVASERSRTNPRAADWEGLCHGWAPAAVNFSEPQSVVFEGAGGIKVPFGSSDIKALLTLYQGNIAQAPARLLGARCNSDLARSPGARGNPECRDTNAGAFHVVLANQIGLRRKSFLADVTIDLEVWNQPVHAFSTRVVGYQAPSLGAAPGTVREAVVQTTMRYTVEVFPSYRPLLGTTGHADSTKTYQYRLELNGADDIIGGEWISEDRPDFLWIQERPEFRGYWQTLGRLYAQASGGSQPQPQPTATATPIPTVTPRPGTTPTPVPTVVPTVTPRPGTTPTPGPTVFPTVLPTPTLPPTLPPVDPVDPIDTPGQVQCKGGYQLYGVKLGAQSQGYVCGKDGFVHQESVTQGMKDRCVVQEGQAACAEQAWGLPRYVQYRGGQECPYGTVLDKDLLLCGGGEWIHGPFPTQVIDTCEAWVTDTSLCHGQVLRKDFLMQLPLQRTGKKKR